MYGNNNYGNGFGGYTPFGGVPPMTPYNYPSPPYNSGIMPPNQQSQSPVQQNPNTNKMYVNGIEDARNRQFPYNSDYILLDNDKPVIYRRVTDGTGKMDIQAFRLVPLEEQSTAPQIDTSQFVLKSDLENFRKDIEQKLSVLKPNNKGEKHD